MEKTWKHGSGGYTNHKCRCEVCTGAWRERHSEYRKRVLVPRHNTRVATAKEGGCIDCGSRANNGQHTKLQFHHRDPSTKRSSVATLVCASDQRFLAEVALCDVLCPDCHRRRHGAATQGACDCGEKAVARGLCRRHYNAWYRTLR